MHTPSDVLRVSESEFVYTHPRREADHEREGERPQRRHQATAGRAQGEDHRERRGGKLTWEVCRYYRSINTMFIANLTFRRHAERHARVDSGAGDPKEQQRRIHHFEDSSGELRGNTHFF